MATTRRPSSTRGGGGSPPGAPAPRCGPTSTTTVRDTRSATPSTWPAASAAGSRGNLRQRLRQAEHRREQVAPLLDALEDGLGLENNPLGLALGQRLLDLLPLHRRGHRRTLSRPQRVDAGGGLEVVVLAPVHQHLAAPQVL